MAVARTVKDVSPHEFVKSYSSHLKRSGKVLPMGHTKFCFCERMPAVAVP
ncbi:40S ribosomal protein S19-1-like [Trifolium medium]|uniref:40S ribosomal protein S19-1-like n=2 Tax=Trifolium medium TaxID=97028 RepID=A0A392QUC0_9FABA|nr:40S ribosomal protein S19-1-like [Trifolium medium]